MNTRLLQYPIIAGGVLAVAFLAWYLLGPFGNQREKSAAELRGELENSPSAEVRAEAAARLGVLRDVESVDLLIAALEDEDTSVRARAGVALVEIFHADYFFRADDPPEKRRQTMERIEQHWEKWKKKGLQGL